VFTVRIRIRDLCSNRSLSATLLYPGDLGSRRGRFGKGRLKSDRGQLFYEFWVGDAVPEDHLVRKIDAAFDLLGFMVN
jgi:hypothetical protein